MLNQYISEQVSIEQHSPRDILKLYQVAPFLDPQTIMDGAYYNTKPIGSATALVGILNNRTLNITNIGDSGFLIVRFKNDEPFVLLKSKE